jgi:hypothetical protein
VQTYTLAMSARNWLKNKPESLRLWPRIDHKREMDVCKQVTLQVVLDNLRNAINNGSVYESKKEKREVRA